ncbi:MAG: hydantoinase B/oxoprolinase family protein [Thermoanaerobaculales bacterium]|nr:hydantoinase B/oxoprolinase family protein [Thermoanaerobaculales bacterium]
MVAAWQIWIDTGGTFTDCIATDPSGEVHVCKVLSNGSLRDVVEAVDADGRVHLRGGARLPDGFLTGYRLAALGRESETAIVEHEPLTGALIIEDGSFDLEPGRAVELRSGEEAPLLATRLITGTPLDGVLPPVAMRLATTRGTNALLERRGARTAHFITAGFEDLLLIGDQSRPDLFALDIRRPEPLPEAVVGVSERLTADGFVIEGMSRRAVKTAVAELRDAGVTSASVALLHGHRNAQHEEMLEKLLRDGGFDYVSRSSLLSPFQGLLRRSQTTVTDAYLGPVIAGYLGAVKEGLGEEAESLHVMTSAGGLVDTTHFRAMDSLLSGPAGGVVGAAEAGRAAGTQQVIAFDMGGTSTDVSRFDGDFEYVFEHRVGPVDLAAPALAIETVAAGGGSICRVEQGRLAVGPESAGADPGPAAYGAGGPLTITDVNLLLGRLVPSRFPIPVDLEAARARFDDLGRDLETEDEASDEEILEGLLRIADERMAEAIRHISVRKGIDPSGYSLVAFGGAGGQHACRVAEILGIPSVILPGRAGILSAEGLGHAVIERFAQREVLQPLERIGSSIERWFAELEEEAAAELRREGVDSTAIDRPRRMVELRYVGQDAVLELEPPTDGNLQLAFEKRYFELFSYRPEDRGVEMVSMRVVMRSRRDASGPEVAADGADPPPASPSSHQRCFLDGRWLDVPCHDAHDLAAGAVVDGPALIQQAHSALVAPTGWTVVGLGNGGVRASAPSEGSNAEQSTMRREASQAVELELMSHRFSSIAREMGEMLKRTAISTNIKEREDFSCTLLDPEGRLVVNAPHIPVHLGAMGLCVRMLNEHRPMAPGDVVVTNHPAYGGSHLPDVTLVAPVYSGDRILGFVAVRAHHAEIGGIRPGSVPPDARNLAEEGVVIPPTLVVEAGEPGWERVEELLRSGPYPSRMPADNLADLRAMLAAIVRGREALASLAQVVGIDHVVAHMDLLRAQAAQQLRQVLTAWPDGRREGRQLLDDGTVLAASFEIQGDRAVLDFEGTSGVHDGNLNATPAIVHSVIMYVMRLLVSAELPLNEGLLEPLEIRIPSGTILDPSYDADPEHCPAVVGGNVETSQRLVDTLVEALELAGCSQGTMNNLSFGDESFGYYETVAGGSGAGNGFDGTGGVHTHMTNTRITDPEVIEHRYPVRLHRFAIRRGSGGGGRWRGGDGVVRELEFLVPLEFSILSQHRESAPFGMAGGGDGAPGRQVIVGASGTRRTIRGIDGVEVCTGDRVILETPGGGGYGAIDDE